MINAKKSRARAIIFSNGKLVTMYREKAGRIFYTFPGGGIEENETEQECVAREVLEEFGLVVEPLKKVYIYENQVNIEAFYLCKWISGEFGLGKGEEYDADRNGGVYRPTLMNIEDIFTLPLMPPQVAKACFEDYKIFGENLSNEIKSFVEE